MVKEAPPSRTADQFLVRLPDGMRDVIADAAKVNNRSMNAEIVARLEGSFKLPPNMADLLRQATKALKREADLNRAVRILQATQKSLADLTLLVCDISTPADSSQRVLIDAARAIARPMAENPDAVTADKLKKWYPDLALPFAEASDALDRALDEVMLEPHDEEEKDEEEKDSTPKAPQPRAKIHNKKS